MQLEERLFRRESGRIVTALTRIFGLDNLTLAEDVAQDVFCRALDVWKLRGVPPNPSAWLMTSAKNRAIDVLRRERTARNLMPELGRLLESEWTMSATVGGFFNAEAIEDDQLRMMFSCCDPHITEPTQVALVLNLVCGFSIGEIASAFFTKRSAMEKRIERGKKVLAASHQLFDLSERDVPARLPAVLRALYLLFNEGYHGASTHAPVRAELCREAIRLCTMLLDRDLTAGPPTFALAALMCLNAARLPARVSSQGDLISLADQDRSLWDASLVARGNALLDRAASGTAVSDYHIEAAIASVHSSAPTAAQTDWSRLVWLYDLLAQISPSPIVDLNRAIALAQKDGAQYGIDAINAIAQSARLASYPFLPAALAQLELQAGDARSAQVHFEQAASLARSPAERRYLEQRVSASRR